MESTPSSKWGRCTHGLADLDERVFRRPPTEQSAQMKVSIERTSGQLLSMFGRILVGVDGSKESREGRVLIPTCSKSRSTVS